LAEQSLGVLDFVLLVADEGLEKDDFLLRRGVIDGLGDFEGLFEVAILVVALREVEFVISDFGVELGELFVDAGGVQEVLAHVVAVGKEGHGAAAGAELQFVAQVVDRLGYTSPTSWYFASLIRV
jgi:hypothetical protein